MEAALIDSDILSEVIKAKDAKLVAKASEYLREHQRFCFSAITQYEITRGFRATGAIRQLASFLQLVEASDVIPVSATILDQASRLWADARNGGHPRDDADLIIAATALETRRALVTGNTAHFSWIPLLRLEDWRHQ